MDALTIKAKIEQAVEQDSDVVVFGVRYDSKEYAEGDHLPDSKDIDERGEDRGELLDGTCAYRLTGAYGDIDQSDDADDIVYAITATMELVCGDFRDGLEREYVSVIGGTGYTYGEDDGEIIIRDARVIARIEG